MATSINSRVFKNSRRYLTGFSLVEILVVMLIFSFLFIATLTVLSSSDRSWQVGQNKLSEQQEARKAMNVITRSMMSSSPEWMLSQTGPFYRLEVTDENKRVDFYSPVFNSGGELTTLKKVTFKLDPVNTHRLLKKEGTNGEVVVSNEIQDINFDAASSPLITITVTTQKQSGFNLVSKVMLRNQEPAINDDIIIEAPVEGEF